MCEDALESIFDSSLYDELNQTEEEEKEVYIQKLREFVNNI